MNLNSVIDYRYFNIDRNEFVDSLSTLKKQLGKQYVLRAIPSYEHDQVLYAGSRNWFTERDAIIKCKKESGVL